MKEGFEIVKAADVVEGLRVHRDTYNERGKYLGFPNLHKHYSMALGTCTDWTGFPRSGKTQLLMETLLNTSMYYNWKHLVYFPDVGSKEEIIADLIHKKTGKGFNPDYDNLISDEEIYNETEWLLKHFCILTKKEVKAKITPFEFWDMAVEMKKEFGIHTASIDSWKDMNHPYNEFGGYAMYLEAALPYRNQIAEDHNLHLHTVIHPKLTDKDSKGNRKPPTPYDLKGGSEWFNSGKCMITVHRENPEGYLADIIFHKMKPRSVGNIGATALVFSMKKFTYFNYDNGNEIYASKDSEQMKLHGESLQPNIKFEEDEYDTESMMSMEDEQDEDIF